MDRQMDRKTKSAGAKTIFNNLLLSEHTNSIQGYQIWHPNWVRLVWDFLRSVSVHFGSYLDLFKISFSIFWLSEPKCTETDLKIPQTCPILTQFRCQICHPWLYPKSNGFDTRCRDIMSDILGVRIAPELGQICKNMTNLKQPKIALKSDLKCVLFFHI